MATIVFNCDGCGKRYEVDLALAGKKAVCKDCKTQFQIPVPRQPSQPSSTARPAASPSRTSSPLPQAKPAAPRAPAQPAMPAPLQAADLFGLEDAPTAPMPRRSPGRPDPREVDDLADVLPKRAAFPGAKSGKSKSGYDKKTLAIAIPGAAIAFAVTFAIGYRMMNGGIKLGDAIGQLVSSVSSDTQYDQLIKKLISSLNEFADLLEQIKQPGDADRLMPQLREFESRMAAIEQEARALPNPTQAEDERLSSTYEAKLKKGIERVVKEGQRLQAIPGLRGGFMPRMPSFPSLRSRPFGGPPPMAGPGAPFGPGRFGPGGMPPGFNPPPPSAPPANTADTLVVQVSSIADKDHADHVGEQIGSIFEKVAAGTGRRSFSSGSGGNWTWNLTPVTNVQAFVDEVKFGRVMRVNGKTVEITANPMAASDRRPPETDVVGRALFDLKSPNPNRRREAAQQLVKEIPSGNRTEVSAALSALVNDSDVWTRKEIVKALGIWGTADSVDALVPLLSENDHGIVEETIRALGQRKDPKGAEAIVRVFENHRGPGRDALISMGPPAEDAVLSLLKHRDVFVRVEACKVLQEIGGTKSLSALQSFARRDGFDAKAAREAIRTIKLANPTGDKPSQTASQPSAASGSQPESAPAQSTPKTGPAGARPKGTALPKGKKLGAPGSGS